MDPIPTPPAVLSRPWAPIPGPEDRVTFFEEQRRNRRATWRLAALCALAVVVMGIPLSMVLTPLLYAALLLAAYIVDLVRPIPQVLEVLKGGGELWFQALGYFIGEVKTPVPPGALPLGVGAMFLPGIAIMGTMGLGLHAVFARAGVGGVLLSLGARPPRRGDLEEHQLENVVQEMALAAGVPAPRVLLLDSEAANAAAIGTSPEDAAVVVSRRLLDEMDRTETQGVIGHLVGSIANGDLRIAFRILSVFQAFGMLVTLLSAPFGPRARATLGRLLRFAVRRRIAPGGADAEAEAVEAMLTEGLRTDEKDDVDRYTDKRMPVPLIPFILATACIKWTLFVFITFLVGPLIALLWRARRNLADATAVQLTRNPDALGRALQGLADRGAVIPGSQWAAHLFIIGPEAGRQREAARFQRELQEIGRRDQGQPFLKRVQDVAALEQVRRRSGAAAGGTADTPLNAGTFVAFHPSLQRRLKRLRALGATTEAGEARPAMTPIQRVLYYAVMAFLGVLMLVMVAACLAGVAIMLAVSLFIMGLFLAAVHGLFYVLGLLKAWALAR